MTYQADEIEATVAHHVENVSEYDKKTKRSFFQFDKNTRRSFFQYDKKTKRSSFQFDQKYDKKTKRPFFQFDHKFVHSMHVQHHRTYLASG